MAYATLLWEATLGESVCICTSLSFCYSTKQSQSSASLAIASFSSQSSFISISTYNGLLAFKNSMLPVASEELHNHTSNVLGMLVYALASVALIQTVRVTLATYHKWYLL